GSTTLTLVPNSTSTMPLRRILGLSDDMCRQIVRVEGARRQAARWYRQFSFAKPSDWGENQADECCRAIRLTGCQGPIRPVRRTICPGNIDASAAGAGKRVFPGSEGSGVPA